MEGTTRHDGGRLASDALDEILAIQLVVAWAGEALTDPPRLGWWRTSLGDELGGHDLFKRLTPRTWEWATLEAARAAARHVDGVQRAQAADADLLRSIFHLGFTADEQLDDRLSSLKRHAASPREALPLGIDLAGRWDPTGFGGWLGTLAEVGSVEVTSVGRRLRGAAPDDPVAAVRKLVAALMPLTERYPAPHFRLGR